MSDQTFSASATVRVRGFDSARHASMVAELVGSTLGAALATAVRDGSASEPAPRPAAEGGLDVRQ